MPHKDKYIRSDDRKHLIRHSAMNVSANIMGLFMGILRSLSLPALLSPAQLGSWNLMNVILSYSNNAHLGTVHAMNKAIPMLRSQGKKEQIEDIKNSVFWFNMVLSFLLAIGLCIVSLWLQHGLIYIIIAVIASLFLIYNYFFSILRAENRFDIVSRGTAATAILSTAMIIVFAMSFSDRLIGALIGFSFTYVIVIYYWYRKGNYQFALKMRFKVIYEMLKMGFPLITITALDAIFISIDRWFVAASFEANVLGYYSLGIMMINMIYIIPVSIASVFYPKMLERFAVSQDYTAVSKLLILPVRAMAVLAVFLISFTVIVIQVVIRSLLPKYLSSLPLIEILVPGAYFMALAPIAGNYLVAINSQKSLIKVQVIAICICLILDGILLYAGYGVKGIAYGTICSYAIYGFGYLGKAIYSACGKWVETMRFLAHFAILFVVMFIALKVTNLFMTNNSRWETQVFFATIRLSTVIGTLLPFIWLVNRKSGLFSVLRTGLNP